MSEPGLDLPAGHVPWEAVDARARRATDMLREAGAGEGRTVAVVVRPDGPGLVLLLGALRTRARVAPLNPKLTHGERTAALDALGADLVVDATADDDRAPRRRDGRPVAPEPKAGEVVLWTSGTSGRPRGVILTQEALRLHAGAARTRLGLGPGDRWYASLSPAHVGGLALLTRAALLGSTVVARGAFDAAAFTGLVDEGRVTHASLVPAMLDQALEAREGRVFPDTLRCLLIGGARCPRELLERALEAGAPVALTWGMTEATSQVATATPAEVRAAWEAHRDDPGWTPSVGRPLEGVEVRVAEDGELLVRGATLAEGLLGGGRLVDADGWYATGDLGEVVEARDGPPEIRVRGRKDDRIVSGGYNVDPAEVEEALLRHPAVGEAAAVGVPDRRWGERVAAMVVPAEGAALDASTVDEHARSTLASPKVPRTVVIAERIPRNPNGKVDREAVRAALGAESGGAPRG